MYKSHFQNHKNPNKEIFWGVIILTSSSTFSSFSIQKYDYVVGKDVNIFGNNDNAWPKVVCPGS